MIIRARALLFDLDGTLIDSRPAAERVWRRWGDRHDIPWEKILPVLHGRRAIDTMRDLAPHLPQPEEADRLTEEEVVDTKGVVAMPGALHFLDQIPSDRWAIVTSCPLRLAVARMNAAGIPRSKHLISAESIQRGKPAPDGYLLAARQLGISPQDCVVFEDAPAGFEAARNAQMKAIAVAHADGGKSHDTQGLPTITNYRDLKIYLSGSDQTIEIVLPL